MTKNRCLIIGLFALAVSSLSAGTLFVSRESANPLLPFASWATAASDIQQAVNAAEAGDEIIVTNGVYSPVDVDKPLVVRSVNGAHVTIIDAARQSRCAYLTSGASLTGFSLKRGTADAGAGVFCAFSNVFLTNCIIAGNACTNSSIPGSGSGGGVYGGTLYNCVVVSNTAAASGGGAIGAILYNCTVTANHANRFGGGVYSSACANSIIYANTAVSDHNYGLTSIESCCTTPLPTSGVRNIAGAPLFVNAAAGDLRLLGTSPCIDAGDNSHVGSAIDLAGNRRILRNGVDIGAYEFPGTNALVFYAWVQHHGVLIDGTTDYADPDGDGMNNWQEWVCFACPTNALKCLRMVSAIPAGANVTVKWESSPGISYFVERSTNLASAFTVLATNLVVQTGQATYTDTNVQGSGPFFYRVGVNPP